MWLSDLCVVLPDGVLEHAALLIEDGHIERVAEQPEEGEIALPCAGLMALPGIVDLHGDMFERELEPRPGAFFPVEIALHELDKRLAAAGVTTAYAAISFWESERRKRTRTEKNALMLVESILEHRQQLLVDFKIHARYEVSTPSTFDSMFRLIQEGKVDLVSLMDHTPGQGQYRDLEHYYSFMADWSGRPRSEVIEELKRRMAEAPDTQTKWRQAREIAGLAVERGLPLASHDDDTPQKVELVAMLGATISEFPVSLEAAHVARARGMYTVMGAPNALRGASTSGNLIAIEGIQAGAVDVMASDYHPGALLHATIRLVQNGVLPLHEAVALVTLNPARAAGLNHLGSLEAGRQADLVLIEPTGLPRIHATLRQGMPIYWDRHMAQLARRVREPAGPPWGAYHITPSRISHPC